MLYGYFSGTGLTGADCGGIFGLQPSAAGSGWTETVLYSFGASPTDVCNPAAAAVVGANGALYGTTSNGGAYGFGNFYELLPPASPGGAWTEEVLYDFGTFFGVPLVAGPGGSFYDMASGGAYGANAVVQFVPPTAPGGTWTLVELYSFPVTGPGGRVTLGPDGILYGATEYYDMSPGAVFRLTPPGTPGGAWTETILYVLPPRGPGQLINSLTVAADGAIYCTTTGAYGFGAGTIFRLTPPASGTGSWTYTLVKNFGGNFPDSPLLLRNGNIFGTITTSQGGAVFELQPPFHTW